MVLSFLCVCLLEAFLEILHLYIHVLESFFERAFHEVATTITDARNYVLFSAKVQINIHQMPSL